MFFRTTGLHLKLLILIKSPNIFHWKPQEKIKVGVVLGQNLGQTRSNVVKKVKTLVLSVVIFIFYMGNIFSRQKTFSFKRYFPNVQAPE